jgi:urease subunit alpha
VLASSTNPTLPYGVNAVAEHVDMILLCHGMNPGNDSDVRIARSRVRGVTMAAEGRLHDLGVIGITSSDAQGMGRAGETWWRTFALASVMAGIDEDRPEDDNERILRYLAKITINPALAHGLSHEVGRLAVGYLADIVLWRPEYFSAKPQLVIKGGFPAWGVTGDPNASIDSAEPLVLGPQYGALGVVPADLAVLFSNQVAVAEGRMPVARRVVPVMECRTVRSSSFIRNGIVGDVAVADDGSFVRWNDMELTMDPVERAPISRLHFW